jgi:hypothetical protein
MQRYFEDLAFGTCATAGWSFGYLLLTSSGQAVRECVECAEFRGYGARGGGEEICCIKCFVFGVSLFLGEEGGKW